MSATPTLDRLKSADWEGMERETVQKIRLLRATCQKIDANAASEMIARDLVLPAVKTLALFCASVEIEGDSEAVLPKHSTSAPRQNPAQPDSQTASQAKPTKPGGIKINPKDIAAGKRDVASALDQCEHIIDLVGQLPDAGFCFGSSVEEKVRDIAETIERTQRVTDGQFDALDNMQAGVERWIRW